MIAKLYKNISCLKHIHIYNHILMEILASCIFYAFVNGVLYNRMRKPGQNCQRLVLKPRGRGILTMMECLCLIFDMKAKRSHESGMNFEVSIPFPYANSIDRLSAHVVRFYTNEWA